jgi:glycosyltransferase involved in cell wall biosynthesis
MLINFHQNKIHTYALNYKKTINKFLNSIVEISRHIKNHNVDIIHAHMFHTLIIASLLRLFNPRLKVVFTPHNSFQKMNIRRFILWLLKPFRDIDTVFSKSAVMFFHKNSPAVIPNGINITDYLNINKSTTLKPFTFIVIGRLEFMKNHQFLINEISRLSEYDFIVKIVGSGLLEDSLKKQVSVLKLDHKIQFLGSRDDVPLLLGQSDCLLLPSLWEAFPIVLLEAAASNIPVVTTPVGSITSFVDNECGYVIKLKNFRRAMIEVMNNPKDAKIKSNKLHKKISSNYQITDIVKQYESIYHKIIK